jgi:uncharacterized membrane protein YoaK (UPF0700 family)
MPLTYLASLMAAQRSARANLHLGVSLAFIAGALNAGGLLAVGEYTSHMTGMLSGAADRVALGDWALAATAAATIVAFLAGAATTAVLVNFARRRGARYPYAPTLLVEAVLLLGFGVAGARMEGDSLATAPAIAVLLCYAMGLQNALVSKISNAEIRTTHVTGLITDIGIELGKLVYWNGVVGAARHGRLAVGGETDGAHEADAEAAAAHGEIGENGDTGAALLPVRANRARLRMHLQLVGAFFAGGVSGALGFRHGGFGATIPLALALVALAVAPYLNGARHSR